MLRNKSIDEMKILNIGRQGVEVAIKTKEVSSIAFCCEKFRRFCLSGKQLTAWRWRVQACNGIM